MLARKWLCVLLLISPSNNDACNICLASPCTWAATKNFAAWYHDWDIGYNASFDKCKALCEATSWCHSVRFANRYVDYGYGLCVVSKCGLYVKCVVEQHIDASIHQCIETPTALVVIVLMSSLIISVVTFAALHLISGFKKSESTMGSISLFGIVVGFGAMPLAFCAQPNNCASFIVTNSLRDSFIFPLNWLTLAGSLIGMTMACLRLRSTAWRHLHALTRSTITYFTLATGFNMIGLIGAMLLSCVSEKVEFGEILLGIWLAGSIGTTLTLHNLMSLRAEILVGVGAVVPLRRIVLMEVLVVVSLFVSACVTFVARQGFGFRAIWFWVPLISIHGCLVFALFAMDLFFSWRVLAIFHDALKKVQASSSSSSLGNDTLAKSLRIATLNIGTVLLSVCTTTIFYCTALICISLEVAQIRSSGVNYVMLIAWVLDSLGNDACAIYIGFGLIADALEIVASAGKADVIGNPLAPATQQEHVAVVGHVLPVPNTTIASGGAAEKQIDL